MPVFIALALMGGFAGETHEGGRLAFDAVRIVWRAVAVLLLIVGAVVVRNTNPRVRIEHAVRFFWGPVTATALAAVALALAGKTYGIEWL
jgi:NADH-quinone oxidoreductase subunit H